MSPSFERAARRESRPPRGPQRRLVGRGWVSLSQASYLVGCGKDTSDSSCLPLRNVQNEFMVYELGSGTYSLRYDAQATKTHVFSCSPFA